MPKDAIAKFLHLDQKSAAQIIAITDDALRVAKGDLADLVAAPKMEKRTEQNTLEVLNRIAMAVTEASSRMSLFSAVHPDAKVRAVAEKSSEKLSKFVSDLYLDRRIYDALLAVPLTGLDADAKRFHEKELLDFKLTGVDQSAAVRREVKTLIARSVSLGQAFDRNIRDDVRYVVFRTNDLAGLPEDYRKVHAPDARGNIRLSTQYPDYLPFMQYAKSAVARKKFYFAYTNRAWPKNEPVFKELLAVRKRLANLVGFENFADYATVNKMIGSGDAVQKFLDRVSRLTKVSAGKDYAIFLARKRKDDPRANVVEPWESGYYDNLLTKERVGLDSEEVRQYFTFPRVKEGVLHVAAKLFGLTYRKVRAQLWHKDVEAYDVRRAGKSIGRFYLDLHPRDGKYGHAACFEVRPGIRGKQLPEAALVCNFSRDLMTHNEVETFLHEFGHLVHFILGGDQRWARFSGYATEWDFVEAPSQMLESWAVDRGTLRTFARHHETHAPIPAALVAKMRKAESFARGLFQRRQLFLSAISLAYHRAQDPRRLDLMSLIRREEKKYSPFRYPQGTHMYANFGHLNGYSAVYYTYAWSRAIAEEILAPFKKHGMYDKKTAKRYADAVLAPGGSKDARELLRDFLGREWNLKAFEKWLKA
jgi:thimet oligopeptidase